MMTTNTATDERRASVTAEGVDTNADGEVEVVVGELRQIESVADASADADGGYVANVASVAGNIVTVTVYQEGDSGGALSPVTGGSGVTDVHINAFGY